MPKIKQNMLFSKNLTDMIEALKIIASSEFKELSSRVPKKNIAAKELSTALGMLVGQIKDTAFLKHNLGLPKCIVMICSDEGFLGGVNNQIVATGTKLGEPGSVFVVLGNKGANMLSDMGIKYTKFFSIQDDVDYKTAIELSDHLFGLFFEKKVSSVDVVFMKFISFMKHEVFNKTFLPYNIESEVLEWKEKPEDIFGQENNLIVEPDPESVLEGIVKLWLREEIYNIFWSAKLSEWSARVMHLEASFRELEDQNKALRFRYFKAVHALNDKNIREIFAALSIKGQ